MAIVVDPAIVVEAKEQYATVELHGHVTRGQMVVDWNHKLKKTPNVRILTRIDQKRYENVALTAFSV
jgi:inosine-uridine nucleoside N-ribohydrolase